MNPLIPQNFPAITRVNRLATMSGVRYPRRDAESHRGRQRDVWTIYTYLVDDLFGPFI